MTWHIPAVRLPTVVMQVRRKRIVFLHRMTLGKLLNFARAYLTYVTGWSALLDVPVHIKIDIAPQCQLRCRICPHSSAGVDPDFHAPALMRIELFQKIVDEAAGKTIAVSLYNLGEPLLHPLLCQMIKYADDHGINTYFTTNLSLPLNNQKIDALIDSGLSMLIVAVDGVSEQTYGPNRVRGKWSLVKANMESLGRAAAMREHRPYLMLQYLVFDYNEHEKSEAIAFAKHIGFDEVSFIAGSTSTWTSNVSVQHNTSSKRRALFPVCRWPFFSMIVNSSGKVSACCLQRIAEFHYRSIVPRNMGDAAAETLASIYRNRSYNVARKFLVSPLKNTDLIAGHFCEDCYLLPRAEQPHVELERV